MNTKYLENQKQWTAFMTISGLDVQEYGDTEQEAIKKLFDRISESPFLLAGIDIDKIKK